MPLAIFCAVNNHGQTLPIGAGLLRNETRETYRWLFTCFLKAVNGQQPGSILTDQDHWMTEALESVMPETVDAYCIWHITQKFPQWFRAKLGDSYASFVNRFYEVCNIEEPEYFDNAWRDFIQEYKMETDSNLQRLFSAKKKIAQCYLREYFFADMTTTQRSESINALMNRFLDSRTNLVKFSLLNSKNVFASAIEMLLRVMLGPNNLYSFARYRHLSAKLHRF